MDLGIDFSRQELKEARARFRSACFAPWSRGNEIEIMDWRSSVAFWERRVSDAVAAQAIRDARATRDESIDNGLESDDLGPYWY